jgi:hypothetical protein
VTYPLALFEELKDLPSVEVLQTFLLEFRTRFLTSAPFLADLSFMTLDCREIPFYLLLPQALLGAALSRDPQAESITEKLWHASTALIIGTVEVDNSLGRTIAWHTAVSFLPGTMAFREQDSCAKVPQAFLAVAFGMMQSKGNIWHQTEIVNGTSQSVSANSLLVPIC